MYIKNEQQKRYWFSDGHKCLGYECFAPGNYQHRGATMSGSRNTSSSPTPCCLTNAYHGCPDDLIYDPELAEKRKQKGWKVC